VRILRWAGRLWTGVLLVVVVLFWLLLGLRLLLPLPVFSARPTLTGALPADGSIGVSPRARITLRFAMPMNPRSVERALRITPPIQATLLWNDDHTLLTISPTVSLQPDSIYQVALGEEALSRMLRPLAQPAAVRFRTAPAPAVVATLPADGASDVALDTPISITFSRAIVPASAVGVPSTLPELRFDPPLAGRAIWIDQQTVLFRPAAPLRPGTRYRATLAAGLADLGGGQLGAAFAWRFSTPAPRVLSVWPPSGARWVAPRAPLVLTIAQPLDIASLQASLVISPPNPGLLAATTRPDGSQVITYTPAVDWSPGTRYTVVLHAGAAAASGNLPLQEELRWSFTTAPQPEVIGRFPGEGQLLPPDQDIRLIFNTPIDSEALRAAIRFTPPVDSVRVVADSVEARITASLRAATSYTMTLPASLTDRNGVPLGREYRIRFLTAPGRPALELPDAHSHIVSALPGPSLGLLTRRTNLSALSCDLYGLDEATTLRALGFREADWRAFQPERYARPLLRSWTMPLTDPLNHVVEARLPLTTGDGQPLSPGVYYLRMRSPEGPRADVLVLISRLRLTLQTSQSGVLVWATDVISATPVGGLPVALYQDGALIQRGVTANDGRWQIERAGAGPAPAYVALAGAGGPGIASSAWSDGSATSASPQYRLFLTTDRAAYRPGEQVALAGFVRQADGQSNALPPAGLAVLLTARPPTASSPIYREAVEVGSSGVISAAFTLAADAPPGEYSLTAAVGTDIARVAFTVQGPSVAHPLDVVVSPPSQRASGADAPVTIAVRTPEGVPVAGALISWTLKTEPWPFPDLGDYTLGDDEQAPAQIGTRSGTGRTDAGGQFSLIVTDTVATGAPMRYRVVARAREPGGPSATGTGTFLVTPAQAYVGVRLPSRILFAGQPGRVDLLAVAPDGRPLPQAAIAIEVYRRTWVRSADGAPDAAARMQPRDERIEMYRIVAGADGRASLPLTLRMAGEYRVLAGVADGDSRRMASATSLWVAAPGFTGWRAEPEGHALLIADRAQYRPGDTATLLITAPFTQSTALLTIGRDGGLAAEVRTVQAGEVLTLTLRPEDAPGVRIAVLLMSRRPASGAAGPAPAEASFTLATTTLPVLVDDRAIAVTITADRASYAPGATATLTLTATDARGVGVPADVILSIAGAAGAPQADLAPAFHAAPPPAIAVAQLPGAAVAASSAPNPPAPPGAPPPESLATIGAYWNPALHTGNSGILSLTVQLPHEPAMLQASAWVASGADRFAQAQTTLIVTRAIDLAADPPAFFRPGDQLELTAEVRNTSVISQEVRATLAAGGVEPRPGADLTQRALIRPGGTARFGWPALVRPASRASISFSAQASDGVAQTLQFERAIVPGGTSELSAGGGLVVGRFSQSFVVPDQARDGWGQLEIELAASGRALANGVAHALAALPERSLLDEASLLLVAAPISDTRPLAQAAFDRLVAAQNSDGGWGWWPRGTSQPFVTLAVLEALTAAKRAGFAVPPELIERGSTAARSVLANAQAEADLRAYALYVLALHGQADGAALRALAASPALGPEGLAYLLLARPLDAAGGEQAALSRLEALALRRDDTIHWMASDAATLVSSDTSATALVLLALERIGADDEIRAGARRWLATTRSVGGWPNAYESARALAALQATEPQPATDGRYVVALNGAEVLDEPLSTLVAAPRQLVLPLDRLQERNELTITSTDAVFVSYRLALEAPQPPQSSGLGLLRDYLDPQTGAPLDPRRLRTGQLVRARLTIVANQARRFVTIADALPAGCTIVEAPAPTGFEHIAAGTDRITLSQAVLAAGIHQYSYLLRAVTPGRYTAPAPIAYAIGGMLLGSGRDTIVEIESPG
jgi:uncharacterized protein YfaS (alpha-2-macroglobulin family)